ncbi:hypothetical protein PYK79_13395 [Streptomyces sp. ID05-04B]|uniref:hypothetical protein n=1 Tax=Streptomyces sp. ID05-04B TaxID=3028661 RepID=UPI0029C3C89B|nr:hypothetical protein [Streptomyces sp. ID05-04B]MDX5564141.1 hypothetical protein [Streptomyces sp. ID05-04B]
MVHLGPLTHLVKVDGVLTEGDAETAREALRKMEPDPYGLVAGMAVQPYVDHGERRWVFRCWGTDGCDGCDGMLSLGHSSQSSAESARDRHLTEAHPNADQLTQTEQSQCTAIASMLRSIAPGHTVTRIWGRIEGATPEQAQEGNAWAADPEDIAELIMLELRKVRG